MKMIIYSLAQGDNNQEKETKKSRSLSCLLTDFLHIFIVCFFLFTKYITTCIALFLLDIQRYVKKTKKETVENRI